MSKMMSFVVGCLLFANAVPADAHPHIWIDYRVSPVVSGGELEALRVTWVFDEYYSSSFVMDMDTDKDRQFDVDEVRYIRENAFSHLVEGDYFADIRVNQSAYSIGQAEWFTARIVEGAVHYVFSIPIERSISEIDDLLVSFFDIGYYISFAPADNQLPNASNRFVVEVSKQPVETNGWGTVSMPFLRINLR